MRGTVRELRTRLAEAEALLRALRGGQVDALVVSGPEGDRIHSLAGAEHSYRTMVEAMTEGALVLAADGAILYSNHGFASMINTTLDDLIGSKLSRFVVEKDREVSDALVRDGLAGNSRGEIRLGARGGPAVPVILSISAFSPRARNACAVVTNLTDQKRNQALVSARALERARRLEAEAGKQRVATILESITDSFFALDHEWRISDINQRAAANFGKTPQELIGTVLWEMALDVTPELRDSYHKAMNDGFAVHCEWRSTLAGHRWFEQHMYPVAEGLAVYFRDITERREAEQERAQLLRRVVQSQEDERRRIALEMHDQFGQQLSALALKLSALRRDSGRRSRLGDELASLEAIARQLDADLELIVWRLRPTVLDDLGLVAAVRNYIARWSQHFGVHAELDVRGVDAGPLTNEIETTLYRLVQEALNNVAKHAQANRVAVLLEGRGDRVSLIVEDNGVGFDTEQSPGQRFGLVGMRERAGLLGGTLDIESHPGAGTTVVARIPAPVPAQGRST